ncbi:hypothetical protein [Oceanobacillus chungangensis]|uniref:hypothetical protein n=1 Tax=Oceanobacillus chungangensis TaxID=1229152 RepID=UPI0014739359|nr:hypothetical protein [Oceanobacillus chungangensis]
MGVGISSGARGYWREKTYISRSVGILAGENLNQQELGDIGGRKLKSSGAREYWHEKT